MFFSWKEKAATPKEGEELQPDDVLFLLFRPYVVANFYFPDFLDFSGGSLKSNIKIAIKQIFNFHLKQTIIMLYKF